MIWVFPAVAGLIQALVMLGLRLPPGAERPKLSGLPERMSEWLLEQVMGSGRSVLRGEVTAEDADAGSLFDTARTLLGDPYASAPALAAGEDGHVATPSA
jgi:hypothetical protein